MTPTPPIHALLQQYPLLQRLQAAEELAWFNPATTSVADALPHIGLDSGDIAAAAERFAKAHAKGDAVAAKQITKLGAKTAKQIEKALKPIGYYYIGKKAKVEAYSAAKAKKDEKKSDKNLKTGIELLKVANSVASVFTLGSGMAPAMKAVTAGMGLLRTASLLSNDSDIARATSQIASAIGTISTIATQMGGIVGSAAKSVSASDHPELAAALTKASDALDGMGSITDDIMDNIKDWVGNNGGGSIKDGLDQLSDASDKLSDAMDDLSDSLDLLKTDAALTSATLAHTSVAMGQMQDGLGGLTDMMGQTRDILHWLNQQDPIKVPRPSAELTNTKDSLFDAVSSINDKMNDINSTMRTASNQLTDKMRAVTAQVSVVSNLMLDAVEEISDPGSKTIYEDESEDLIASQSDGKIENSINRGSIDADMNVGGIAGTMGVENLLDPEEDNKDEGTSLLRTS